MILMQKHRYQKRKVIEKTDTKKVWAYQIFKNGEFVQINSRDIKNETEWEDDMLFRLYKGKLEFKDLRYDDSEWKDYITPDSSAEPVVLTILQMLGLKEASAKQLIKEQIKYRDKIP